MKLNEEEKKGILLDEDKSSEEIDSIWMELTNNFFLFFYLLFCLLLIFKFLNHFHFQIVYLDK